MSFFSRGGLCGEPYPSTDKINPDKKMAKALCDSLAGEMSSINFYVYYSVIFSEKYPSPTEVFEEISMVEMIHFRLVSECIRRLGEPPSLSIRLSSPTFEADLPGSSRAIRCSIERSICEETAAYDEYLRLAEFTRDSALRDVLSRLACDEEEHRKILEGLWI